jgi:hypothetical protein
MKSDANLLDQILQKCARCAFCTSKIIRGYLDSPSNCWGRIGRWGEDDGVLMTSKRVCDELWITWIKEISFSRLVAL